MKKIRDCLRGQMSKWTGQITSQVLLLTSANLSFHVEYLLLISFILFSDDYGTSLKKEKRKVFDSPS